MEDEIVEEKQYGKYGKEGHLKLVKASFLYLIDRYYSNFGSIRIENTKITMGADIGDGWHSYGSGGKYSLHPDICMTANFVERMGSDNPKKIIIVECETSPNNLLKNEMRLTAYKLLRLNHDDKGKYMMYLSMPIEYKGKIKKPEFFNNIWFFDLEDVTPKDIFLNHKIEVFNVHPKDDGGT